MAWLILLIVVIILVVLVKKAKASDSGGGAVAPRPPEKHLDVNNFYDVCYACGYMVMMSLESYLVIFHNKT